MKKKICTMFLNLFVIIFSYTNLHSVELEDLNDEYFSQSIWHSYIQDIDKIFKHTSIQSVLEFGLGYGTKYFLDRCQEVNSIEIILSDQSSEWYDDTLRLFKNYSNWKPQLIHGSQFLYEANLKSYRDCLDPALYDATYILELKDLCENLCKDKEYDLIFVDPGFHMRGDLVNELFDKTPIIVADDTNYGHQTYGWWKINTPYNYEKIEFKERGGTTFWIRKDKKELITALKGQCSKNKKKNLRVFFPDIHFTLTKSLALALEYLGHTLVLPGESFQLLAANAGPKLTWYFPYNKKNPFSTPKVKECPHYYDFLRNVEIIENDEILTNPPDILFVNCDMNELDIFNIKNLLKNKNKDVKIAHYSGNNKVPYTQVKNLIAVDAYTANTCNRANTNIVFWIPWIDFETLKFEDFNDDLILNNYISHYYPHFYDSYLFFKLIFDTSKYDLPLLNIYSPERCSPLEIYSLIDKSSGTLHIKETEGFGYSIIESLAKGRPVFLKRSFSLGSRLMNWCIENKTAFFFDDYSEFKTKIEEYFFNENYRHEIQQNCASIVRKIIDNEKQARILENFLQNLE